MIQTLSDKIHDVSYDECCDVKDIKEIKNPNEKKKH